MIKEMLNFANVKGSSRQLDLFLSFVGIFSLTVAQLFLYQENL